MVRWIIVIPLALLFAVMAGAFFFVIAAIADPVVGPLAGNTLFVGFSSLMDALVASEDPDAVFGGALAGAGRLTFTLFVLPPAFIALVGEVAGLRRLAWYAGATALVTAAVPWLIRGTPRVATPDELRVALVLALTGAAAGFIYWALAGRSAGRAEPRALASPGT